ncbi:hypothetical protein CYLTODRAFT_418230 [Cylindrobasidium torrendii FP15055 ss-10]|uniref:Late embryogenesis abundant protein LEA-2 subgroup domain-containing protein n=1 Tax=Cylindrobasidium torrendii FP15055 ss-10 TaxID=1314674 RepID=A0A0D7BNJ5_9AGAR|nr:hypothetical protein CYLTODRAFT_418230 [Cylindrobasidium torrendii FP15055 ss-10]
MAYQDPYAAQYGRHDEQQPYRATSPEQFNPYANHAGGTQPYDQGGYGYSTGYRDEPYSNDPYYQQPHAGATGPYSTTAPPTSTAFEATPYTSEKPANVKAYRNDTYGENRWTKGSRVGCFGRFFCCTFLIVVFIFVSIILSLALWIRPPAVSIGDVTQPESGSQFQLTNDGVKINFQLNVTVNNPNYFGVSLKKVETTLFYPINNTDIGGGVTKDVTFDSHSNKTITFPFSIDYSSSIDPNNAILLDLLSKCGITGTASDITVSYDIQLSIRVLMVTVSPTVSNKFSFACPLDQDTLSGLLGDSGLDVGSILGG